MRYYAGVSRETWKAVYRDAHKGADKERNKTGTSCFNTHYQRAVNKHIKKY